MLKTEDLRAMTPDQLDDELIKLKKEQFNLRFQRATGQLANTVAGARGAARHRPDQDRCAEAARGRRQVRSRRCRSAFCRAKW